MQTNLSDSIADTAVGKEADRILRSCVHCGFCNATCPTYRLFGDELDGPRGRIYLMKSALEGEAVTDKTQQHLDRCLTCRACETTCPSGVEYGKLLDIGRNYIEPRVKRSLTERALRKLLLFVLPYRARFQLLLSLGQSVRAVLPSTLKQLIPEKTKPIALSDNTRQHERQVILLGGCVQAALAPNINRAARQILERLQVSVLSVKQEQCCGALNQHLQDSEQARELMRNNIDTYWRLLENGVEAIVSTASGCGVQVKEYAHYFKHEPDYADKAKLISSHTKDLAEIVSELSPESLKLKDDDAALAFQSPCTLQHGQKLNGLVESLLERFGCSLSKVENSFLCCGSAGTYSILQSEISAQLRQQKLATLLAGKPEMILTANIGCLSHLAAASPVPIKHWAEYVAERLID